MNDGVDSPVTHTRHIVAIDPLITNTFIDSCAFDPKYEPESTASLEILRRSKENNLIIDIAHSTQKEIEHPNTPKWVKDKATELGYTIRVQLTPGEKTVLRDIENILAGNGRIENIAQDACHVFEAQKYGSYFITTDDRILRRADALRRRAGVEVVRPSEFLALLTKNLAERRPTRAKREAASEEEIIMDIVQYKAYEIHAVPCKLVDTGLWQISIQVFKHREQDTKIRSFSAADSYKTREEAVKNCFQFGKQIIDGQSANCSVADL